MKKSLISALLLTACLGLTACQNKPVNSTSSTSENIEISASVSEVSVSEPVSVSVEPETNEPVVIDNGFVKLTDDEKVFYNEFIKQQYNYGFLMSNYSDARYVDLSNVFYNGDLEGESVTEEDYARYYELTGEEEIYVSLCKISYDRMDEIVYDRTGYHYSEMNYGLYNDDLGVYDYDNQMMYMARGDVNYFSYDVVDGYHPDENTVVLLLYPSDEFDYYGKAGLHTARKELALKVENDHIYFLSCRELIDEDLIMENCYDLVVPYYGSCSVYSYAPKQGNYDVTFKVVVDGDIAHVFGGQYDNNIIDKTFTQIVEMGFDDYNNDGCLDMVAICEYMQENNEYGYDYKVYTGTEYGYFYYDEEMSNYAKERTPELTVESTFDTLKGPVGGWEFWKEKYIDAIENSEFGPDDIQGYTYIYLDDNEVPELVAVGSYEALGNQIISCHMGMISTLQTQRLWFTYLPGTGLLDNRDGNMGFYYDYIYRLTDAGFEYCAHGSNEMTFGENGETEATKFIWDDKEVSEEEYYSSLEKVFDYNCEWGGYDYYHLLTREEILSLMKGEYSKSF